MNKNKNTKRKILSLIITLILTITIALSISIPTLAHTTYDNEYNTVTSRIGELIFTRRGTNGEKEIMLCPGGDVFGARISGAGVRVTKLLLERDACALREGDKILRINGNTVSSVDEVKEVLSRISDEARIAVVRDGKSLTVTTTLSEDSDFKLGVVLSDNAAGIGTVTYIDPRDGSFGGLGHGICDTDSGKVLPMCEGNVSGVILGGAAKGESGKPGELRGILTHDKLGDIEMNTEVGVFGKFNEQGLEKKLIGEAIPVGKKSEVHEGTAQIISTVKGGRRAYYDVNIFDIDYTSDSSKSFKVKVTDETLIALTGGIVRGMSGSPIIQDGKLVGAVTHVMVANPTEGYGIFIENMLSAAQNEAIPKAA